MNDLVAGQAPSSLMNPNDLAKVITSSLYPGAKLESALMVIEYCKAAGLDPMQKPVHIVNMRTKIKDERGNEKWGDRDVIMPGIGLYRVQAARTSAYAGMDEPVFGPEKTMQVNKKITSYSTDAQGENRKKVEWKMIDFTYPEWCKVTVYRMINGVRCPFTAVEYWLENYATQGGDSEAPNDMWSRRARAQLAKCTEAQALRKAFPEVGSQHTFDEMEGKTEFIDAADAPTAQPGVKQNEFMPAKREAQTIDNEVSAAQSQTPPAATENPTVAVPDSPAATPGLIAVVQNKLDRGALTMVDVKAKFGIEKLDGITTDLANKIIAWTRNPAA